MSITPPTTYRPSLTTRPTSVPAFPEVPGKKAAASPQRNDSFSKSGQTDKTIVNSAMGSVNRNRKDRNGEKNTVEYDNRLFHQTDVGLHQIAEHHQAFQMQQALAAQIPEPAPTLYGGLTPKEWGIAGLALCVGSFCYWNKYYGFLKR